MKALACLLLAGCSSAYSIRIDGDVLAARAITPREVHAGIYDAAEAQAILARAAGTLQPGDHASIAVKLVHQRWNKFQRKLTDLGTLTTTPAGHFHLETYGRTSDGAVEGVQLFVTKEGRPMVMRQIPASPGDPVEVRVLVVVDEAYP